MSDPNSSSLSLSSESIDVKGGAVTQVIHLEAKVHPGLQNQEDGRQEQNKSQP